MPTSWPSLQVDLRNAGVAWIYRTVLTGGRPATSRGPDDLPAFSDAAVAQFIQAASPPA